MHEVIESFVIEKLVTSEDTTEWLCMVVSWSTVVMKYQLWIGHHKVVMDAWLWMLRTKRNDFLL